MSPTARDTGAVTLIQRFGSALNLNVHFHMIFLDGVYLPGGDRPLAFRHVPVPITAQLQGLVQQIAERIGRILEKRGLIERDMENHALREYTAYQFDRHRGGPAALRWLTCWMAVRKPRMSSQFGNS